MSAITNESFSQQLCAEVTLPLVLSRSDLKKEEKVMMQKAEKNEEIEKVSGVFGDYIRNSSRLEWIWSEKLGYVLLQIHEKTRNMEEGLVIRRADRLCRILVGEIAQEVLNETGKEYGPYGADPEERARIRERLSPWREQLPEYRDIFDGLIG